MVINLGTAQEIRFATATTARTHNITGNLTIQGSGTVVGSNGSSAAGSATITIGGNLLVSSGTFRGINDVGNATFNIAGNITNNGTWQRDDGSANGVFSTVLNGSSINQTIAGTNAITFENLTINSSSIGVLNRDISIVSPGSLTINGTLDCGTSVVSGTGAFTIASSATLKTAKATGITDAIAVSGTKAFSSAANYEFQGAATGTFTTSPTTLTVNNLTINRSAGVNLDQAFAVNGTLTMTSGVISGSAVSYGASGTLKYDGASYTTTTNTEFPSSGGPANLNLNNADAGGLSLHASRVLTGTLTIASGEALIIPASTSLTAGGNTTINQAEGLVIRSTGSFKDNGTITGSGTAKVERSIANSSGWHFLSSPVAAQNICDGNFAPTSGHFDAAYGATYDFFYWSEPVVAGDLNWINLKKSDWGLNTAEYGGTPQFAVNKGYLVNYGASYSGSATKSFTGALNTGDQSVTLTTGGNTWNLIGNPFPSAINWGSIDKGNLADNYCYIYNPAKSGGAGYEAQDNGYISPMQGFFVSASGSSLSLPNSARAHGGTWMKNSTSDPVNQISLQLSNTSNFDETVIRLDPNGTTVKGRNDAFKLLSLSGEVPQVYTLKNTDEKICINSLPFINDPLTLPVGMYIPSDGNYTLELTGMESFPSLPGILLEDLSTHTTQNMVQTPVYTFTASAGIDQGRFLLHFAGPIGIGEKPGKQTYMIFSSGNSLFIQDNTGKNQGNVFVYNIMGQLIASSELNGNSTLKMNLDVPAGYYIVKVRGTETIQSSKVFIP